jgi:hypothetical protein
MVLARTAHVSNPATETDRGTSGMEELEYNLSFDGRSGVDISNLSHYMCSPAVME